HAFTQPFMLEGTSAVEHCLEGGKGTPPSLAVRATSTALKPLGNQLREVHGSVPRFPASTLPLACRVRFTEATSLPSPIADTAPPGGPTPGQRRLRWGRPSAATVSSTTRPPPTRRLAINIQRVVLSPVTGRTEPDRLGVGVSGGAGVGAAVGVGGGSGRA